MGSEEEEVEPLELFQGSALENELKKPDFKGKVEEDGWAIITCQKIRQMRPASDFPDFQTIVTGIEEKKRWVDNDAPTPTKALSGVMKWVWPEKVWPKGKPRFFRSKAKGQDSQVSDSSDVNQGRCGDCWFISAMAAVVMYTNLFKRVIGRCDAKKGVYEFKFFCQSDYQMRRICVDAQVPCVKDKPAFCSSSDEAVLWPLLLEKAFAKAYGSYGAVEGGFTSIGFCNLTGFPGKCYSSKVTKDMEDPQKLWTKLVELCESGHIIGCSFKQISTEKKGATETTAANGLVAGHAYGIMQACEVGNYRLVKIRNPWGRDGEWKGDWSDQSSKWKENPDIAEAVSFKNANDGIFYMEIKDLAQQVQAFDACRCFKEGYSVDWNGFEEEEEEEEDADEELYEYEDEDTYDSEDPQEVPFVNERLADCLTWQECADYATDKGGRLLTEAELRISLALNGPLYPGEDVWAAVTNDGERDWIQVGDMTKAWGDEADPPGTSHGETYGYPDWGDTEGSDVIIWTSDSAENDEECEEDEDEQDEPEAIDSKDVATIRRIQQLFQSSDKGHKGYLNAEDLAAVLKKLPGLESQKVEILLAAIDTNKDGKIQINEFITWLYGKQ